MTRIKKKEIEMKIGKFEIFGPRPLTIKVQQIAEGRWHWLIKHTHNHRKIAQSCDIFPERNLAMVSARSHKKCMKRLGIRTTIKVVADLDNLPPAAKKIYNFVTDKIEG